MTQKKINFEIEIIDFRPINYEMWVLRWGDGINENLDWSADRIMGFGKFYMSFETIPPTKMIKWIPVYLDFNLLTPIEEDDAIIYGKISPEIVEEIIENSIEGAESEIQNINCCGICSDELSQKYKEKKDSEEVLRKAEKMLKTIEGDGDKKSK